MRTRAHCQLHLELITSAEEAARAQKEVTEASRRIEKQNADLRFAVAQQTERVRRAEEEHQAVLEAKIVQRGSDHASTLGSMWSLGALLAADCLPRPLGFVFILFLLPELLLLPLLPLRLCACVRAR